MEKERNSIGRNSYWILVLLLDQGKNQPRAFLRCLLGISTLPAIPWHAETTHCSRTSVYPGSGFGSGFCWWRPRYGVWPRHKSSETDQVSVTVSTTIKWSLRIVLWIPDPWGAMKQYSRAHNEKIQEKKALLSNKENLLTKNRY